MNETAVSTFFVLYAADEPLTTTAIAREIYDPDDDHELRNADRKVRYHLDEHEHLLDVDESNGKKEFTLREESLFFGLGRINVVTLSGDEVDIGMGEVMVYEDDEGHPTVERIIRKEGSENDL